MQVFIIERSQRSETSLTHRHHIDDLGAWADVSELSEWVIRGNGVRNSATFQHSLGLVRLDNVAICIPLLVLVVGWGLFAFEMQMTFVRPQNLVLSENTREAKGDLEAWTLIF